MRVSDVVARRRDPNDGGFEQVARYAKRESSSSAGVKWRDGVGVRERIERIDAPEVCGEGSAPVDERDESRASSEAVQRPRRPSP